MARKTRPQIVIAHLKQIGRITDATARAAYGSFSLAHAIWLLRNKRKGLVPAGKKITTIIRQDVAGNDFAEYRLVDATPPFLGTSHNERGAFMETRQYAA